MECASLPSSVNRPHPRFFRVRSITFILDLKAAYFIFEHNLTNASIWVATEQRANSSIIVYQTTTD